MTEAMSKYILIALAVLHVSIATACSSQALTNSASPSMTPVISSFTATPIFTPTIEPCAFVEATQDLPDLSAQIAQAIKQLQPAASGRAQAYGENCIHADGHADFLAKETDFYVTINVTNLKDNNELGTWIVNVMDTLAPFPPGVVPGSQPGFVEFMFKTADDHKGLRVFIRQYKQLPSGLSGAEVIKALFPNP